MHVYTKHTHTHTHLSGTSGRYSSPPSLSPSLPPTTPLPPLPPPSLCLPLAAAQTALTLFLSIAGLGFTKESLIVATDLQLRYSLVHCLSNV